MRSPDPSQRTTTTGPCLLQISAWGGRLATSWQWDGWAGRSVLAGRDPTGHLLGAPHGLRDAVQEGDEGAEARGRGRGVVLLAQAPLSREGYCATGHFQVQVRYMLGASSSEDPPEVDEGGREKRPEDTRGGGGRQKSCPERAPQSSDWTIAWEGLHIEQRRLHLISSNSEPCEAKTPRPRCVGRPVPLGLRPTPRVAFLQNPRSWPPTRTPSTIAAHSALVFGTRASVRAPAVCVWRHSSDCCHTVAE